MQNSQIPQIGCQNSKAKKLVDVSALEKRGYSFGMKIGKGNHALLLKILT